jgi:hypothetical protein
MADGFRHPAHSYEKTAQLARVELSPRDVVAAVSEHWEVKLARLAQALKQPDGRLWQIAVLGAKVIAALEESELPHPGIRYLPQGSYAQNQVARC